MRRRVHVPSVIQGRLVIGPDESHHLRDVLRLETGAEVELFDAAGRAAVATIVELAGPLIIVNVGAVKTSTQLAIELTIAAAVPKGDRAEWMIEKLCELGVTAFIPLEAARSVVLPTGKGKAERWQRIAIEAAKQSRRSGVMTIAPLTKLADAMQLPGLQFVASTGSGVVPLGTRHIDQPTTIFIGPEGGWTDDELGRFAERGVTRVSLTSTILRIETAAVTAAALLLCK